MKKCVLFLVFALAATPFRSLAQSVNPMAYYTDSEGVEQETTSIDDGQAPLEVTFRANPEDMTAYSPTYEWHFRKMKADSGYKELFVRYEEDTQFTFRESGTYNIVLHTRLDQEGNVLDSVTIVVSIAESKLEFPNAFSPNGDGINDIYKAKDGWRSIVEFRAIILNRWGQKLYEWTDPDGGWDGKFNGTDVKDGVYFVQVIAKGADGRKYHIRKDVNLLRGYTENGTSQTN